MSEKTLLSMSEAAQMVGMTRPTFYRKVDELGISVNEDGNKKRVDVSELIRVFGNDFKLNQNVSSSSEKMSVDKEVRNTANNDVNTKLAILEAELKREKELREELKDEIVYFKEQVTLEKEEKNKITLLLEDHRQKQNREGAWEKSIKALEQRIANQEKSAKEREEVEQKILDENRRLKKAYSQQKKALESEKNKPLWKKLFG